MPVYLIRAGGTEFVKIGKADDPIARVRGLQCGHYETLHLLKTWPGGLAEEAAMHSAFADFQIRNEWFRFTQAMLSINPQELAMRIVCEPLLNSLLADVQRAIASSENEAEQAGEKARKLRQIIDEHPEWEETPSATLGDMLGIAE